MQSMVARAPLPADSVHLPQDWPGGKGFMISMPKWSPGRITCFLCVNSVPFTMSHSHRSHSPSLLPPTLLLSTPTSLFPTPMSSFALGPTMSNWGCLFSASNCQWDCWYVCMWFMSVRPIWKKWTVSPLINKTKFWETRDMRGNPGMKLPALCSLPRLIACKWQHWDS